MTWHFVIVKVFLQVLVGVALNQNAKTFGLYFPMGNVSVTIPDASRLRQPLMTLRALPTPPTPETTVTYTFTGSRLLRIEPVNGTLHFSNEFYEKRNGEGSQEMTGTVTAKDIDGNSVETTVHVSFVDHRPSSRSLDCDFFIEELCFWHSVNYKLQENRPPTSIGSLSSPYLVDMCRKHRVEYTLLDNATTSHLSVYHPDRKQWLLRNLQPFERDILRGESKQFGTGAIAHVGVRCTVIGGGTERHVDRKLTVEILDEDDNVPRLQNGRDTVEVALAEDGVLKKLHELIFIDKDSKNVNNYAVKILNDTLGLFRVNFTVWADDRNSVHQTAIHCKLWPVQDGAKIPSSSYAIVLQINDTTLLAGNRDSTTNTTIHFRTPRQLTSPAFTAEAIRTNILYDGHVKTFRTAAPLARIVQPKPEVPATAAKFRIRHDSSADDKNAGAFNVTVRGGIVYVQDVDALRRAKSPVRLEIEWKNSTTKEIFTDSLSIELVHESNPSCTNMSSKMDTWPACSRRSNFKSCTERTYCGLGTGGSIEHYARNGLARCLWRGDKKPGNAWTTAYSTCTPDTLTCPDSVCDPLEELHNLLCPQDCTPHVTWTVRVNNKTGLGIHKAKGICTCDEHGKCSCRTPEKTTSTSTTFSTTVPITTTTISTTNTITIATDSSSSTSTNITNEISYRLEPNVSRHTADILGDISSCGTPCLIGIAAASLFLLGAITTIVACWRTNHGGKGNRRERKYTPDVNTINGVQSDYINRTATSAGDTILLNFDMSTSLSMVQIPTKNVHVVDPKWEFPREKLRIEQTLGEGEFGRVLRARAFEIASLPGYTTVAVKTLKEDARDSELTDLMSEYQLLKEVSHPNVIRLLGASTLPGGPVYLIIEFAEHGSLRNYLRRSRHLEAEGQTPCSGVLFGETEQQPILQPTCKISPRDILSFAWQISKGMSYLNDMKLVHRDLAARNVLLATDMVCKISDFGLTRDVYEDDTYLKRTRGRVPVKWMAPESLADHIYNSKSDVWSFGILLWELVTLGASPYPGVAVQNLFHLLRSGYRMERPDNCSPVLYKIMLSCWSAEACHRPTFRTLTLKFESMLADGIDYLDLNPRVVHNRTYFTGIPDSLITPDDLGEIPGYGNLTMMHPDTVNLLSHTDNEKNSAQVDKLQVLWKKPDSPKPSSCLYANEEKIQELQHYESPIKFRTKSNGLKTPTNERPQSYLDMAGATTNKIENQALLRSKSGDEIEKISKVTSL